MYRILTLSVVSALAALAAPYDVAFTNTGTSTSDATPLLVARRGADDAPGHVRRGRGTDDAVSLSRRGADDPATDQRRGRGRDDVTPGGRGADDPPGHLRRGRGAGDPLNHG